MEKELFEVFVHSSKAYYSDRFDQYQEGKKFTFNLPAFLFGVFWFLYRKMHWEAFILFILMLLYSIIEDIILKYYHLTFTDFGIGTKIIGGVVFSTIIGYIGNRIYIKHAIREINSIKRRYQYDEELIKEQVRKKGGTSLIAIGIILTLLISIIVIAQKFGQQY